MWPSSAQDPLVRRTKRVSFMGTTKRELCFDVVMDGPFTWFSPWEELCGAFSSSSLAKFFLEIAAVQ